MKIEFEFNEPTKNRSTTGIMPGMFNDDIAFKFAANGVHTTDKKEIDEMLAELDKAVTVFKKAAKSW